MKTILAATDFSEGGNNAVFYAASLAQAAGAGILLVHAYKAQSSATTLFKGINDVLEQDAKEGLEGLKAEVLDQYPGLTVGVHAAFGEPAAVVDYLLSQLEVSLVVTGTKGKSLLDTLFFGSTSIHLFTNCTKPLLLVPSKATFEQNGLLSYATALREGPTTARLAMFQDFARWWKASWRVVHAFGEERSLNTNQQAFLEAWNSALELQPEANQLLSNDDVLDALMDHIDKEHPLVLAIHRHHYSFIERIFVPSVGEALARKVKVPLLVLPQQ